MQVTNDAKIENRYGSERPVMRPLELRPFDLTFDKLVRGSKERPAAKVIGEWTLLMRIYGQNRHSLRPQH
jgi:hypothetical protein